MEQKTKTILIATLSILFIVVVLATVVCVLVFLKGDDKNETTDTVDNPESFKALVHTERFGRAKTMTQSLEATARKPRLKQPLAKEKRDTKPVSYLDSYIDSSV